MISWTKQRSFLPSGGLGRRLARRVLGQRPFDLYGLNAHILNRARLFKPDVVLISKGASIAPETVSAIKAETGAVLINYATDDPFNRRVSTAQVVQSIALYDVYACTKLAIMDDVARVGVDA